MDPIGLCKLPRSTPFQSYVKCDGDYHQACFSSHTICSNMFAPAKEFSRKASSSRNSIPYPKINLLNVGPNHDFMSIYLSIYPSIYLQYHRPKSYPNSPNGQLGSTEFVYYSESDKTEICTPYPTSHQSINQSFKYPTKSAQNHQLSVLL